jgi:TetR/AcrR family transcriptional regulator, cholesterol catabolism regulator
MHNYTYLWMRSGGRVAVQDLAAQYADIFVRGISNPLVDGLAATPSTGVTAPAQPGSKKRGYGAA